MSAQRRADLTRYFLRLGALGFGGPVALVARMRQDLVDDRAWIAEEDFRDGLALAQVAPGPLAAQLAMYLGWLVDGVLGATVVGVAFVLPSLLIVLVLAAGYTRAGGLPILGALFYGVGAAVIAVLARAGFRLARSTVARDRLLWLVTGVNAVATVVLRHESVLLVLLSGLFVLAARSATRAKDGSSSPSVSRSLTFGAASMLSPLAGVAAAGASSIPALFVFFAISGLVVFGSGLAIVPFLHGGVVVERHWLTEQQFLDAVAISLLTPGPVVITVAFIGFIVAGPGRRARGCRGGVPPRVSRRAPPRAPFRCDPGGRACAHLRERRHRRGGRRAAGCRRRDGNAHARRSAHGGDRRRIDRLAPRSTARSRAAGARRAAVVGFIVHRWS